MHALLSSTFQIADFGMARDVGDDTYYVATGGKIPLKWTAPEVWILCKHKMNYSQSLSQQYISKNFQFKVMCGVLDVYYMKYGAWDISHMKILMEERYVVS